MSCRIVGKPKQHKTKSKERIDKTMPVAEAEAPEVVKEKEPEKKEKLPPLPPAKKAAKQFFIKSEGAEGCLLSFDEQPIKKGDSRGTMYFVPLSEQISNLVKAFGEERVLDVLIRPRMKLLFQNLMDEATAEETGEFSEEEFIKLVSELSARGETIPELLKRQFELADEMSQYDYANPEHIPILLRIARQIKATTEGIRDKKRKTKADKEAELAAKASIVE